ncbi:MAG: hypothetical protein LBN18_01935 [Dysgonamonadaceae bacterium]|jgi:flagellar biosynthesis/type III secretory pathway M-ring protein FliF/YscJ|nr:hypothetical protein [Dysgonamonadaceae bacterium]
MKEIFYIIGFVALCFIAYKVMSKVKDTPNENLDNKEDKLEEDEQPAETEQ